MTLNELSNLETTAKNPIVGLIEMVVYKPFSMGRFSVLNVPHLLKVDMDTTKKERIRSEHIEESVQRQVDKMLDYMKESSVFEMDFQQFSLNQKEKDLKIANNDLLAFATRPTINFEKSEITKYVLKEWLQKYFEMNLLKHSNLQGDIKEKLDYFHASLNKLPASHQKLIEMKYLNLEYNGSFPLDDFIYEELCIGKTLYYKQKKEALYWLGLALIG